MSFITPENSAEQKTDAVAQREGLKTMRIPETQGDTDRVLSELLRGFCQRVNEMFTKKSDDGTKFKEKPIPSNS